MLNKATIMIIDKGRYTPTWSKDLSPNLQLKDGWR